MRFLNRLIERNNLDRYNFYQIRENLGIGAGIGIANKISETEVNRIKNVIETSNKIDESQVISGIKNLISNAITNVMSKNTADVLNALNISNKINLSGIKVAGDFNLTNITQDANIITESDNTFIQTIQAKIVNDMSSEIINQFNTQKNNLVNNQESTSVGDAIGDVIKAVSDLGTKALDVVGNILEGAAAGAGIGNTVDKTTINESERIISTKFETDKSFKLNLNEAENKNLQNLLSQENLAKCAQNINSGGEINVKDIIVDGNVNISNILQKTVITQVAKCAFDQKVVNELSNKVFNSLKKLLDDINNSSTTASKGDIYAVGAAVSGIVASTGTAASEIIGTTGEAVKDIGEGAGTVIKSAGSAVKDIGTGLSTILKGATMPLIVGAVIAVVLLVGYLVYRGFIKPKN